MTTGPWRPISLQTYDVRITDLRVQTEVPESLDVAIKVSVEVSSPTSQTVVALKDQKGKIVRQSDLLKVKDGKAEVVFSGSKGEFDLWYPVGYGKQPMYTVEAQAINKVCIEILQPIVLLETYEWTSGKYSGYTVAENRH
jgi:beta-mannosidase